MGFTTPRTWVAGEYPTAAIFNTHVRDNLSLLANPPACKVYTAAGPTVTNNTLTTVTFTTASWNTDTNWSSGTNPSRITATTAGKYLCFFDVEVLMSIAAGQLDVGLFKNGGSSTGDPYQSSATFVGTRRVAGASVVSLAAGDYVELKVFQNTGASATLTSNVPLPFAGIHWMGL